MKPKEPPPSGCATGLVSVALIYAVLLAAGLFIYLIVRL